ncbi:MAG: hypothetical protein IKT82_01560 [Bacteroidaceae bacterium]|jgi:tetratricopeptide (TPR) repeat protein|nr:hypothetical protein [Bacteroidaceae bacterium]
MKIKSFLLLAITAGSLASCSKMGALSADNFTVVPSPLEAVANEVPVTINGRFPEKYMKKKAEVTVIPVLRFAGKEVMGEPATFQGEKVIGNNQEISYRVGGNYVMRASFPYEADMIQSELYLAFDARKGKKTYSVPDVLVAKGVLSTSALIGRTVAETQGAASGDAFQYMVNQSQKSQIKYLINQSKIRLSELSTPSIQEFVKVLRAIKEDQRGFAIDGIEVMAYASPDGKQEINERLAKARQASSSDYINDKLEELELVSPLATRYTAEDWEGFQELVGASNIQDKEIILRVLSMYEDPEERERQIKNISAAYTELIDEVLPELRRARITLNYVLIGRTDEEILKQLEADPTKLSVEELLYVATFDETAGKQKDIYTKTVQLYPNDYRAYNNLGLVAQLSGNMEEAKQWFTKAASINSSAPEVNANLALVALAEGNIENAEAYLGRASEADNYNELLAALQVCKGNYTAAATNAKNGKSTTAALALIMNKDYATALTVLNVMPNKTATTDYLKAVCYARQNRTDAAITALASAFQKDPTLKERAAKDLEFAKLANKSAFQSLF